MGVWSFIAVTCSFRRCVKAPARVVFFVALTRGHGVVHGASPTMMPTVRAPTMNGTSARTVGDEIPLSRNVGRFVPILTNNRIYAINSAVAEPKRGDVAVRGPGGEEMHMSKYERRVEGLCTSCGATVEGYE